MNTTPSTPPSHVSHVSGIYLRKVTAPAAIVCDDCGQGEDDASACLLTMSLRLRTFVKREGWTTCNDCLADEIDPAAI